MTNIKFTKMQGLGNDFVILDYEEYKKANISEAELAKKLCDRHFGIGADGLIIVNPNVENADIGWLFYNSDGSVAQMCGNGIRCFARYVYKKGIIRKNKFTVSTLAGIIEPVVNSDDTVRVKMSIPVFDPEKIPVKTATPLKFEAGSKKFTASAVSMGNPHCVIVTNEDTKMLAKTFGSEIEHSPLFPEKVNVEFIKILSRGEFNLDVWERGCGITLACGTGACAATVVSILNGYCDNKVRVNLPGGQLLIEWSGNKDNLVAPVYMTGSATFVFSGEIGI